VPGSSVRARRYYSITEAGQSAWWYPKDYNREVDTSVGGANQTTVPIRSGQRQGFAIGIYNPTDVAQTVLGPAYGPDVPGDSPGSPFIPLGSGCLWSGSTRPSGR
jgi:hypothetical protein